jgi:hypothetical protein
MKDYDFFCHRVHHKPELSGDLKQLPWSEIQSVYSLTLSSGDGAPEQATRFMCGWDDDHFYVGFQVEDRDIHATMTERDAKVWQEEAVEFFVSPDEVLTNYYEFQFSPRNVVRDIRVENPNGRMEGSSFHGEWDCQGLKSAVHVEGKLNDNSVLDAGWSIEIALPFECLLGSGKQVTEGDTWRINFFRVNRWPKAEFSSYVPTHIKPWEFHVPKYFARMTFQES